MFHSDSSSGHQRTPLPPAQRPAAGVPSPRHSPERPAPENRPTKGESGKKRDAFFDNAKYLAIVLVAMGHSWEPVKAHNQFLKALYDVVYTLHMPAFIIISGFFSRSFDARPDRLRRLVTGVVVPYVLFETAYSLFKRYVGHTPDQPISLLDPWYLTWFLCALFVWRLTTPIWRQLRHPLAVALVVAMAASVSPDIGNDLDMQRVLQFLPYFVLGLTLRPEHFRLVRRWSVRIAAVPVFAVALAVAYWAAPQMNTAWFYHRDAAQELAAPWWVGPLMVLALFACSLVLTACFYSWVPGRRMWFTSLGAGTLYGYLLHGFLLKGADLRGWFEQPWLHRPLGVVLVTLFAVTAVTLLCTPPVQRVFRFAMEPRMEWAFRRDAGDAARRREGTSGSAGGAARGASRERVSA
ncbi:acyltransferase family protein [Streptomyces mangrovisoli]|uniref:Acyltransferase 3 domain-containing protein n=1 Tax=Streptomyces mangrovisoli TaxID=1428628 RepID=A0A1J4P6P5_9ACTN|nr:acyltransferase family protein [Streptomyces mangrovisoli]OIJ69428.1 hypothetical protein WN71_002715 [Streptomyces mangrovisoli]